MRLVVKVAVAGLATYAAYRAVKAFAPEGVKGFVAQVKAGMGEREAQLREALGLDVTDLGPAAHDGWTPRHGGGSSSAERSGMTPEEARALLDDPTGPRAPQG